MIINIFDNLFGEGNCSVAYQVSKHVTYVRREMEHKGITLFVDGWLEEGSTVDAVQCQHKIGWLREPYCLHPTTYEHAWQNRWRFETILTYYEPFLHFGHPFRLCPYGGVWIPESDWGMQPKSKLCSFLVGSKMGTAGHRIRRGAAEMLNGTVDLFDSRDDSSIYYGPLTKLQTLKDYAFSIVTETCREDNLFTEWTLDAFSQGTIPILWACPNIDQFFNAEGILSWETLDELSTIVSRLSFGLYSSLRKAAQDNLDRTGQYAVTEDWLWHNILGEYDDSSLSA